MLGSVAKVIQVGEPQHPPGVPHTPGIPDLNPQMKRIANHKLLLEGLGYVQGVCWKILFVGIQITKYSICKSNYVIL